MVVSIVRKILEHRTTRDLNVQTNPVTEMQRDEFDNLPPSHIILLVLAILGCVVIFLNIVYCLYRIYKRRRFYCESNRNVRSSENGRNGNKDEIWNTTHVCTVCREQVCQNNLQQTRCCGLPSIGMPRSARPYTIALPLRNSYEETTLLEPHRSFASVGIDNMSYTSGPGEQDMNNTVMKGSSLYGSVSADISLPAAVSSHSSSSHLVDNTNRELFQVSDRSITQTICGKQVVSIAKRIGHEGGTLILDNMGIFLKIPEGAVDFGQWKLVGLVLNWDLTDNPQMSPQQSLVSPVVFVGPNGLKLNKECILSFRHCAFDPRHIRVMRSETDLYQEKDWKAVCDKSEKDSRYYCTADEVQIKINSFNMYTCIQQPVDNIAGKKWLQIAVFACPLRREIKHHQIRVYFLNKTPCALQWAIQNEANFSGKLVCPEKVFLFDGGELDMFAITRYISKGWLAIDDNSVEKVSFLTIWHGHCPHVSICYKRDPCQESDSSSGDLATELSLNLFTYQTNRQDDGEKIFIQVAEDRVAPFTKDGYSCKRHHVDEVEIEINTNLDLTKSQTDHGQSLPSSSSYVLKSSDNMSRNSGQHPETPLTGSRQEVSRDDDEATETNKLRVVVNARNSIQYARNCEDQFLENSDKKPRKVPHHVRQKLKILLDPEKSIGSDWRDLAAKLDLDQCIPKLERYESPTEKLLNYIENQAITLNQLQGIFRDIDREDCATELEAYAYATRQRVPVENEISGFYIPGSNTSGFGSGSEVRLNSVEESRTLAKRND